MPIYSDAFRLFSLKSGSSNVTAVYSGSTKIWPEAAPVVTITMSPTTVKAGAALTFNSSISAPGGVAARQWLLNGAAISGATATTYVRTTALADNGKVVTLRVTDTYGQVTTSAGRTMSVTPAVTTLYTKSETQTPLQEGWTVAEGNSASGTTVWRFSGSSPVKFTFSTFGATSPNISLGSQSVGATMRCTVRFRYTSGPNPVAFKVFDPNFGTAVQLGVVTTSSSSWSTQTITWTGNAQQFVYLQFSQSATAGNQPGSGEIDSIVITRE